MQSLTMNASFNFFYMQKFIISIFLLICTSSYAQTTSKFLNSKVIIRVSDSSFFKRIDGLYKLTFKYFDENSLDHILVLKKGVNIFNLKAPSFLIQQDFLRTPFYVCPGDDLEVLDSEFNGIQIKHKVNRVRTAELNFFSKLSDSIGYLYISTKGFPKQKFDDVLKKEEEIEIHKSETLNFAKKYFQQYKVSSEFKNSCEIILEDLAYQDSLLLINEYQKLYIENNIYDERMLTLRRYLIKKTKDFAYYSNLESVELFNSSLLFQKSYNYPKDSLQVIKWYKYINDEFRDKQKEILMKRAVVLVKSLYKGDLYPDFDEKISHIEYTNVKLNGTDNFLNVEMDRSRTLFEILQTFKERIFFIDFWASWCKPCREEIPFSKKLQPLVKNKIKFIYFSIDDDPNSWKRAIEKENMSNKDNFLLLETNKTDLNEKLKISTIPRYVILDNKMNVLLINAPRPSDSSLIKVLNSLYKESTNKFTDTNIKK